MKRAWLATLLSLGFPACNPLRNYFEPVEPAQLWEKAEKSPDRAPDGKVLVMDWNIKFGGGRIDFFFDCFGNRSVMTRAEVESNLEGIRAKINQVNPDILFLQEADVGSKRSAHINMVRWILDRTELNYAAYASQWRVEFIPAYDLGEMDSGNAVLSRWPITEAVRLALPLSSELGELERQYNLKRNILRAKTSIPGSGNLTLIVVHTDAYSKDGTKKKHIDRFIEELDAVNASGEALVAGGDLNELPPGTVKLNGFPDSVCANSDFIADDFSAETEWLAPLYRDYESAIPLAEYQADNSRYFSHTVDGRGYWNRTLDYLFTNRSWVTGSGLVHQNTDRGGMETMPLSDHAPITASLDIGSLKR